MLHLTALNSRRVKQRAAALMGVIRSPDIEALWSAIQSDFYDNQRAIVRTLHERGALRRDLDVARASDILWTLNHPDLWHLLVGERGWTPEQWERWFRDTAIEQLLAPAAS
jgi:hypothetical protein